MNSANDQILTLQMELRAQDRLLNTLDKKTHSLEQTYQYQHEMLDKIEVKVNEIDNLLKEINKNFNKYQGASEIKLRLVNYGWMAAGILSTVLFNDVIVKKFWS